jgi:zinc transport system ATP-binding protein
LIRISEVSKSFGKKKVLSRISFEINKEDFVAIIGPNGAGKTTLLKIIDGLLVPDEGTVRVFGENPVKKGLTVRKKIGFVFQSEFIPKNIPLSVKEVISVGRTGMKGLFRKLDSGDSTAIRKAIEEVGILDLEKRPAGFLSGGEQRKVSIARELAREVEILLLDEILMNLDPSSQMEINTLISNIYKEHKLTIIFVTHLLRYLPEGINRVIAIKDGRIFKDFPPKKFDIRELSELYGIRGEYLKKYVGNFKI